MISMKQALHRIKGNLPQFLPDQLLDRLAPSTLRETRNRKLNPQTTTALFFRQILEGNIAVSELRRLSHLDFTESAYCQARQRLPAHFFGELSRAVIQDVHSCLREQRPGRWRRKHRVFLLDGSSFSMPDTQELRDLFSYPPGQKEGCGFPTAHLLVQMEMHHGYLLDAIVAPWHTHDLAQAQKTHSSLRPDDVVVADRAFCSYSHLALLQKQGVHAVFRAHQRQIIDFTPGRPHAQMGGRSQQTSGQPHSRWVRSLGEQDQIVDYFKPQERPAWMKPEEFAALPESMRVREVRLQIRDRAGQLQELTLVTTLLDVEAYPKTALADLYEKRWLVEGNLKQLKEQMELGVLRCKTVPGVMRELHVILTIYNLVRRVMVEAARKQKVSPNRISFADALYWLRHAEPGEEVPKLKVVPKRPGRAEPRAKKRRPKQYPLLTQSRDKWKQSQVES